MKTSLLSYLMFFGREVYGVAVQPYATVRGVVNRGRYWELFPIWVFAILYFVVASIVRTSLFRPFVLTRQFAVLAAASVFTYMFVAGLFWFVGKAFGGKGKREGFFVGWGYSLIPTTVWFWVTSLLYVAFPPPRSESTLGVLFSVLYLTMSGTLFLWKVILSYLALRFGLQLDLRKIIGLCVIVLPIVALYSIGMYRLGIFRVPFI